MQKITPFLWFDLNAEEAINFYTGLFDNSRIVSIKRHQEGEPGGPTEGLGGKVLTAVFELVGQQFMALDGGDYYKFTPAVSFSVSCATVEEVDKLWTELSAGGSVLMELAEYPFSKRYGWCNDRFGVSWQISLGEVGQKITPSLLFVGDQFGRAQEAMDHYTAIMPDSRINMVARYEEGQPDAGKIMYANFTLAGGDFVAMDSGLEHKFGFTGAVSFYVECADQAEVDKYWEALLVDGQAEQCGWLRDKFGVYWQIIPEALMRLVSDPDPAKAERVMQAMLQMVKIDIAGLEAAYNQE